MRARAGVREHQGPVSWSRCAWTDHLGSVEDVSRRSSELGEYRPGPGQSGPGRRIIAFHFQSRTPAINVLNIFEKLGYRDIDNNAQVCVRSLGMRMCLAIAKGRARVDTDHDVRRSRLATRRSCNLVEARVRAHVRRAPLSFVQRLIRNTRIRMQADCSRPVQPCLRQPLEECVARARRRAGRTWFWRTASGTLASVRRAATPSASSCRDPAPAALRRASLACWLAPTTKRPARARPAAGRASARCSGALHARTPL